MAILYHWTDSSHEANPAQISREVAATYSSFPYSYANFSTYDNNGNVESYLNFPLSLTTFFFDCYMGAGSGSALANSQIFTFMSDTTNLLGVRVGSTATNCELVRWNGSSWDVLATVLLTAFMSGTTVHKYSFEITLSNTVGVFKLYRDGAVVFNFSGDTVGGAITTCNRLRLGAQNSSGGPSGTRIYNAFLADEDTRDIYCQSMNITSVAGDLNSWSGSHLDISEVAQGSASAYDITTRASAVDNDEFSQNISDPTAPFNSGYTVVGVGVHMRAFYTTNPKDVQPLIRRGGVNAYGTQVVLTPAVQANFQMFTLDPVTGVAFTYADLAAVQIGARTKAA
jgi:hypothetical protein